MDCYLISKRFKTIVQALEQNGIVKSKSSIADKLDIHRQSLNEILKDKRNVTLQMASKICEVFDVNPSYILLGDNPMFLNKKKVNNNITYIPIKAQAGYGDQIMNPVFEKELDKFHLPGSSFSDDDYFCFEVEGDSMYPTFVQGDNVICSSIPSTYFAQALKDNQVYIIVTTHSLLLKRIVNKIKENGTIELHSDNPSYEIKAIPLNEIKEIWRVEGFISKRTLAKNKQA
ncbi:MAG: hypothetical protein RLZZ546_2977 [Bacteroidota bacterium]|jgi:plasmid maintenance system antidote protein VapI